jgi:hypothetical protein
MHHVVGLCLYCCVHEGWGMVLVHITGAACRARCWGGFAFGPFVWLCHAALGGLCYTIGGAPQLVGVS